MSQILLEGMPLKVRLSVTSDKINTLINLKKKKKLVLSDSTHSTINWRKRKDLSGRRGTLNTNEELTTCF